MVEGSKSTDEVGIYGFVNFGCDGHTDKVKEKQHHTFSVKLFFLFFFFSLRGRVGQQLSIENHSRHEHDFRAASSPHNHRFRSQFLFFVSRPNSIVSLPSLNH